MSPALNPCFTATSYYPAIGGAQLYLHEVARRMVTDSPLRAVAFWEKHRTDWLLGTTINAPGQAWRRDIDGIEVRGVGLTGAERARVALPAASFYLTKRFSTESICKVLAPKIDAAAGGDLIHNSRIGREPFSYASLQVARRRGVPFVFTPNHHPRWIGWNYREYLRLYGLADVLVVYTEAERDFLIGMGIDDRRIFVTGVGPVLAEIPEDTDWRAARGIDGPIVLYLGQKYRYKNFHLLLESAPAVWERHPDAHFVFVGPSTPFSRELFEKRDADPRVIELDGISIEEKTAVLAACDMLCLPSPQESFGMVLVEAWSMGKPVIAARSPAVETVVADGEDGLLVDPGAATLAAAVGELLDSPLRSAEMGAAGAEKARTRFAWDRVADSVRAAYAAALELPPASER